jgi:hypothetical protein
MKIFQMLILVLVLLVASIGGMGCKKQDNYTRFIDLEIKGALYANDADWFSKDLLMAPFLFRGESVTINWLIDSNNNVETIDVTVTQAAGIYYQKTFFRNKTVKSAEALNYPYPENSVREEWEISFLIPNDWPTRNNSKRAMYTLGINIGGADTAPVMAKNFYLTDRDKGLPYLKLKSPEGLIPYGDPIKFLWEARDISTVMIAIFEEGKDLPIAVIGDQGIPADTNVFLIIGYSDLLSMGKKYSVNVEGRTEYPGEVLGVRKNFSLAKKIPGPPKNKIQVKPLPSL